MHVDLVSFAFCFWLFTSSSSLSSLFALNIPVPPFDVGWLPIHVICMGLVVELGDPTFPASATAVGASLPVGAWEALVAFSPVESLVVLLLSLMGTAYQQHK